MNQYPQKNREKMEHLGLQTVAHTSETACQHLRYVSIHRFFTLSRTTERLTNAALNDGTICVTLYHINRTVQLIPGTVSYNPGKTVCDILDEADGTLDLIL